MDHDQFQSAADELLDRVAENDLEASRRAEPARPREDNYAQLQQERAGYNRGSMRSQQAAAILTNNRVNAPYFEHAVQEQQQRQKQRQDVDETRVNVERRVEQSQNGETQQPTDRSSSERRESEPEQTQAQEVDWQRYAQNKEYRAQVDEREKAQNQMQQRQATVQRDRER